MKSFLREPLVHFAALGALLFIGDMMWQNARERAEYTISISPAEMQRQAAIFASENRRQPDDEDLQALLFAHVEERVLMREAKRLGLDTDDTIIRRRLAQKMRFMINDVGNASLPDEPRLKDWFTQNLQDFVVPEQRSFDHIFISPEGKDANIDAQARAMLTAGIGPDWSALGDPFIMARSYQGLTQAAVTKDFGRDFARDLFALEIEGKTDWQGPIASAFGLHLVRVTTVSPRQTPKFEDVRARAEALWLERAARDDNTKRLTDLIKKYNVVVEE